MALGKLGISLGISPVSSAMSDSGMKMWGDTGGATTGGINVGHGADGAPNSWFSGVIRDFVIGGGCVIAVVYIFGKMK